MLILDMLIMVLALYGIFMLMFQLHARFTRKTLDKKWVPAAIVIVDEAQEWIEWFVRKLSWSGFMQGKNAVDIFIIDLSRSSETFGIISRLQTTHPFITYIASSENNSSSDVIKLLQTTKRSQALVASLRGEQDMQRFLLVWQHMLS